MISYFLYAVNEYIHPRKETIVCAYSVSHISQINDFSKRRCGLYKQLW